MKHRIEITVSVILICISLVDADRHSNKDLKKYENDHIHLGTSPAPLNQTCPKEIKKVCNRTLKSWVCAKIQGTWQCVCSKFQYIILTNCMKFLAKHCYKDKLECMETFVKYQCQCFKFEYDRQNWHCVKPRVYPTEQPCPKNSTVVSDKCDRICKLDEKCCFSGCGWVCKPNSSPYNLTSTKHPSTTFSVHPPITSTKNPVDFDVRKLIDIVDTNNSSTVFIQREKFADEMNDILKLSMTDLRACHKSATIALKTLVKFREMLGQHLQRNKKDVVCIQRSHIAIDVFVRKKRNTTIVVQKSSANMSIGIQDLIVDDFDNITNFHGAILLPSSFFKNPSNNTLYTSAYKEPKLFVTEASTSTVISSVISVSMNNHFYLQEQPMKLDTPIQLVFKKSQTGKAKCVFWKFGPILGEYGSWAQEGCWKKNETDDGLVYCECNHLTNFALLLDVSQKQLDLKYLSTITWIGSVFSLVGLLITIATYTFVTKVKNRLSSKIIVRLSISLALLMCIFLAFSKNKSGDEKNLGCRITSVCVHLLLLSTFMWMAVQAFTMYRLFVKPLSSFDESKYLLRATCISLMVPALIVTATAIWEPDNLCTSRICVVRGLSFFIGVVAPIAIVLVFNISIIVMVAIAISNPTMASKRMTIMQQCKITFLMSMLLGGTWLFAMFALGDVAEVFQVLFCLTTPFQGFFLFTLFVLMKKDLRDVLLELGSKIINRIFCMKRKRDEGSRVFAVNTTAVYTDTNDSVCHGGKDDVNKYQQSVNEEMKCATEHLNEDLNMTNDDITTKSASQNEDISPTNKERRSSTIILGNVKSSYCDKPCDGKPEFVDENKKHCCNGNAWNQDIEQSQNAVEVKDIVKSQKSPDLNERKIQSLSSYQQFTEWNNDGNDSNDSEDSAECFDQENDSTVSDPDSKPIPNGEGRINAAIAFQDFDGSITGYDNIISNTVQEHGNKDVISDAMAEEKMDGIITHEQFDMGTGDSEHGFNNSIGFSSVSNLKMSKVINDTTSIVESSKEEKKHVPIVNHKEDSETIHSDESIYVLNDSLDFNETNELHSQGSFHQTDRTQAMAESQNVDENQAVDGVYPRNEFQGLDGIFDKDSICKLSTLDQAEGDEKRSPMIGFQEPEERVTNETEYPTNDTHICSENSIASFEVETLSSGCKYEESDIEKSEGLSSEFDMDECNEDFESYKVEYADVDIMEIDKEIDCYTADIFIFE